MRFRQLFPLKISATQKWIAGAIALFVGFTLLTLEMREAEGGSPELIHTLDIWTQQYLFAARSPSLNAIMVDVTALGSTTVLTLIVSLVLVYEVMRRNARSAFLLVIAALASAGLTQVFKHFFARMRPDIHERLVEVAGYSYPSGHSVSSSCIYLSLAFILAKPFARSVERAVLIALFVTVIFLIGFSRIYLGVHYLSDVLAGFSVGIGCASCVQALEKKLSTS